MAQLITCCISSDHGILDGHEEDVDPLMLLIQDIMDILHGIRNENRHSLLTVLRKNLPARMVAGVAGLEEASGPSEPNLFREACRTPLLRDQSSALEFSS